MIQKVKDLKIGDSVIINNIKLTSIKSEADEGCEHCCFNGSGEDFDFGFCNGCCGNHYQYEYVDDDGDEEPTTESNMSDWLNKCKEI
jgi:hypothetical protein